MFTFTDRDGYEYQLNADLKKAFASIFSGQMTVSADVSIKSPKGEQIKVTNVTITLSRLMTLVEALRKAETAQRPGDFWRPLFGELRALMEVAKQ